MFADAAYPILVPEPSSRERHAVQCAEQLFAQHRSDIEAQIQECLLPHRDDFAPLMQSLKLLLPALELRFGKDQAAALLALSQPNSMLTASMLDAYIAVRFAHVEVEPWLVVCPMAMVHHAMNGRCAWPIKPVDGFILVTPVFAPAHWTLMVCVVHATATTVHLRAQVLDSLQPGRGCREENRKVVMSIAKTLLHIMPGVKFTWSMQPLFRSPIQRNGVDCGIWVLWWLRSISIHVGLPDTILHELLQPSTQPHQQINFMRHVAVTEIAMNTCTPCVAVFALRPHFRWNHVIVFPHPGLFIARKRKAPQAIARCSRQCVRVYDDAVSHSSASGLPDLDAALRSAGLCVAPLGPVSNAPAAAAMSVGNALDAVPLDADDDDCASFVPASVEDLEQHVVAPRFANHVSDADCNVSNEDRRRKAPQSAVRRNRRRLQSRAESDDDELHLGNSVGSVDAAPACDASSVGAGDAAPACDASRVASSDAVMARDANDDGCTHTHLDATAIKEATTGTAASLLANSRTGAADHRGNHSLIRCVCVCVICCRAHHHHLALFLPLLHLSVE